MKAATRITVSTFGSLMGLAGIEHGIGEILQGSLAPAGIIFPSWPQSPFFRVMAGEPAMSIVPNLLITGILATAFSLAYIAWAAIFVQRKNASRMLILLAIPMLLTGAGLFPPILGMLIGAAASRVNTPPARWLSTFSPGWHQSLGRMWGWSYALCVSAWLVLCPGMNILAYFFSVENSILTSTVIVLALGSHLLTFLSGFSHDSCKQPAARPVHGAGGIETVAL